MWNEKLKLDEIDQSMTWNMLANGHWGAIGVCPLCTGGNIHMWHENWGTAVSDLNMTSSSYVVFVYS